MSLTSNMMSITNKFKRKNNVKNIRHLLEKHHDDVVTSFHKKHAKSLGFIKKHSIALASAAILSTIAAGTSHISAVEHEKHKHQQELKNLESFISQLNTLLYDKKKLNTEEENIIADALSKKFGLNLSTTLDGNRLNEIYGYVGKEQHLKRWAGDNLREHGLQSAGMAPLQGAFRDFDNADQEKYYVAVQLHELPGWNENWPKLKPWYRYRKVFMYNPVNQKGIVAVIGDAGPSKFTGKTFGGSPEVMDYLEMKDGGQKGKAIILFLDDKDNNIALGPINSTDSFLVSK